MKLIHYISTPLGQVYTCATWDLFHNTTDILLRLESTQKSPEDTRMRLLFIEHLYKTIFQNKKRERGT